MADSRELNIEQLKEQQRQNGESTMEAVNKTKVLKAIQDKPNHVAVMPVKKSELQDWMNTRSNANNKPHEYTKILQGISVKVK